MTKANPVQKRRIRTRSKITSSSTRPRLSVHRTNQHIYAQIIDDAKGITLAVVSDKNISLSGAKIKKAFAVGELIAQKAKTKKITQIVFDRGSYRYHGRIKAVADGARKGGLKF